MKKVTLVFPDTAGIENFIHVYELSNVDTNATSRSLTAVLSYQLIGIACTDYKAYVQKTFMEVLD